MKDIKRPFGTDDLLIDWREVGPFVTNTYVVGCQKTKKAAVVDAADRADMILRMAENHGLEIVAFLQTHAHVDHVGALARLKEEIEAPIYIHEGELPAYEGAGQQGFLFGMKVDSPPAAEKRVEDGDRIAIGELEATVMHTPGHSPGSVCYRFGDEAIFVGDTLFAGSIGRTDLPGGSFDKISESLRRLVELPQDITAFSGHGPATTIREELKYNPFLR